MYLVLDNGYFKCQVTQVYLGYGGNPSQSGKLAGFKSFRQECIYEHIYIRVFQILCELLTNSMVSVHVFDKDKLESEVKVLLL